MIQFFVDMNYKLGHFILDEIIRLSNLIIELCRKLCRNVIGAPNGSLDFYSSIFFLKLEDMCLHIGYIKVHGPIHTIQVILKAYMRLIKFHSE